MTDPAVCKEMLTGNDSTVPTALLLAGLKDAMVMPMKLLSVASDTHYIVWGVPRATGGKPVALGGVAGSGGALATLSVSAAGTPAPANFTILAVSVEPAEAIPPWPTAIVATGHAQA